MADLDALRARFGAAFVERASARHTLARIDAINAARRASGVIDDAAWAATWRDILAATHPEAAGTEDVLRVSWAELGTWPTVPPAVQRAVDAWERTAHEHQAHAEEAADADR